MIKGLGWRPDIADIRDFTFSIEGPEKVRYPVPDITDLRMFCLPVRDQGNLGSCTAQSVGGLCEHLLHGKQIDYPTAPLFLYYCTRSLEHTIESDSGATLRTTMKAVRSFGISSEGEWPYVIEKFRDKPKTKAYEEAKRHQSIYYQRVNQTIFDMQYLLAQGYPFVFGFSVYESFADIEDHKNIAQLPKNSETLLGGHAVMAVGYNVPKRLFIIRNSWGKDWGDEGYFYMPYSYIQDKSLSSDFWTIQIMEDGTEDDHVR